MNADELAEIRARTQAATPGPWAYETPTEPDDADPPEGRIFTDGVPHWPHGIITDTGCLRANGRFIAHAREDVPALLREVERLRTDNAALREIAQAVAAMTSVLAAYGDSGPAFCVFACSPDGEDYYTGGEFVHAADCPVTKVRALPADTQDGH